MSAPPPANAVAVLEDRDADGRGLRVEFIRLRDRYAHRIFAIGCEELSVPILESVEGAADDPWPPSPALQALNIDQLEASERTKSVAVAMLVGMSGKSHWSLSVEIAGTRLSFDVACRIKYSAPTLGCRYKLGGRLRAVLDNDRALLHFGSGRCALEATSSHGFSEPTPWQFDERKRELNVSIAPQGYARLPSTRRWAYSLLLLDD